METLNRLFKQQREFSDRVIRERNINFTQEEWLLKILVALEDEISEVRGELNWKWWKNKKPINVPALHEEIADLWIFLIQLTDMAGLSAEDIVAIIDAKTAENHARQDGTSKKKGYAVPAGDEIN